jgi:hypothetical protein
MHRQGSRERGREVNLVGTGVSLPGLDGRHTSFERVYGLLGESTSDQT